MLLSKLLSDNIERVGEYPFLMFGEKSYTNVELDQLSNDFAAYLCSRNIKNGERVIVCLPNCPEVIISYQAILKSSNIVVPVLFTLNPNEIRFIVDDSQAEAIITSSALLPSILQSIQTLWKKPLIIVADRIGDTAIPDGVHVVELYQALKENNDQRITVAERKETDLAVILYTSGTTGRPKGVMLTHQNLYASALAGADLMRGQMEEQTTVVALPLAHSFGFTAMNTYLLLGSSVVILARFDVDEMFKAIEKHRIKTFAAVPAMVYAMVMSPNTNQYDFSSLEGILSSSAPLPLSIMQAFEHKFGAKVWEGYGLSEAAPVVSGQWKGMKTKPGSVGPKISIMEAKIVDLDGNPLPLGEVGELIVKGPNVTPGYYRLEEETRKTIVNGWLHTGDLAKMDEDGYIYIVDRKKDLIIRGGQNVFPRDVEEVVSAHPDVAEVAVVGVPDERMGEQIIAYIVKKPNNQLTEDNIISLCQEKLAKYKTPKQVFFIDQLPRNGVGKILKRKLAEQFRNTEVK